MNQTIDKKPTVEVYDPNAISDHKQSGESSEQENRSNHWQVRSQEQDYAFLDDTETAKENRYGQLIDLIELLTNLQTGQCSLMKTQKWAVTQTEISNMGSSLLLITVLVAMLVNQHVLIKMITPHI